MEILTQVLNDAESAKATGRPLLVVFDLDSTLFCVSPRTQAIVEELSQHPELLAKFPDWSPQLRELLVSPSDWGLRQAIERHQLEGSEEFFQIVRRLWGDKFFSNDYLEFDKPYPGALSFLLALDQRGAEIHYLTGRDQPRMGEGTRRSLAQHGFPLRDSRHLHLKPASERHDAEFKKDVLIELQVESRPSWFFENEPVIINLVRRFLPKLKMIFVDSIHSGREVAPADLPRLPMSYEIHSRK